MLSLINIFFVHYNLVLTNTFVSCLKKQLIIEGKTKVIFTDPENPTLAIVKNKSAITADNDPTKTREFANKAIFATNTTCRVFELLAEYGIPVAYDGQISETEFKVIQCDMIPLEMIARRYAVGSFLKRHPELKKAEGETPHRFDDLKIEFFLKTSGGKLIINKETVVDVGDDPEKDDPLIADPYDEEGLWKLIHPKKPASDPEHDLNCSVDVWLALDVVTDKYVFSEEERSQFITDLAELTKLTFEVLEVAWEKLGCKLIDFKIEFGIDGDGNLLVADVIDNDSWRLRDQDWQEISKESFRQGEDLTEVERKYGVVSEMVNHFADLEPDLPLEA